MCLIRNNVVFITEDIAKIYFYVNIEEIFLFLYLYLNCHTCELPQFLSLSLDGGNSSNIHIYPPHPILDVHPLYLSYTSEINVSE